MAGRRRKRQGRAKPFLRQLTSKRNISYFSRLILRLLPFAVAVALLGIAVKAGVSFLSASDYFKIKTIRIADYAVEESRKPAGIGLESKKGNNIFSVNLKDAESEVRQRHPELKDIRVRRVLPDTLEIYYNFRRPFCQVDSGGFYLVSDDAVVLPEPLTTADADLPIITGIDVSERLIGSTGDSRSKALKKAISLLKEIEASNFSKKHRVVKVNMYDSRNPSLYLEDNTRIEIGEYSFSAKEKLLEGVMDDLASKKKNAKIIDLRFEDVIVIPR